MRAMTGQDERRGTSAREVAAAGRTLRSKDVSEILCAVGADHVDSDALGVYAVERGLDPEGVRALVLASLEPFAVTLSTFDELSYWFFPTTRIRQALHVVDTRCTPDAAVASLLASEPAVSVQMHLLNAIHSCRLDGIEIDVEGARDLLLLERNPRTAPERVVANSFALFRDIASYAERELDVAMMIDIYDRLVDGLRPTGQWLDATDHTRRLNALTFATPRKTLDAITTITHQNAANPDVHPAVNGLNAHADLLATQPFPRLNGTVARLVMHIQAVRNGYPVLGIAPFSMMYARWQDGQLHEDANVVRASGLYAETYTPNITGWVTLWLHLATEALRELERALHTAQAHRAARADLLALDPELNDRQLELLSTVSKDPTARLRIMAHKTSHDIAYSTARADLLGLEAKGFVVRGRSGRAATYRAAPNLAAGMAENAG